MDMQPCPSAAQVSLIFQTKHLSRRSVDFSAVAQGNWGRRCWGDGLDWDLRGLRLPCMIFHRIPHSWPDRCL